MVSDPKSNEWNLLKDQFDALVHNEGVRQDNFEQVLDDGIRRRFGELIAWAAGTKLRVIMAPGHRVHIAPTGSCCATRQCGRPTNA
jgi:hypothetical protein